MTYVISMQVDNIIIQYSTIDHNYDIAHVEGTSMVCALPKVH